MATAQMGSFSYDMLLNFAKFEDGLNKAQVVAQKGTNAIKRSIEDGFEGMRKTAERGVDGINEALQNITGLNITQLGTAGVIAGFGEITKKAIEMGDQLNKLSQRSGIGVGTLSGIAYAADLSDVALGDLTGTLDKFGKGIAAAAAGSAEAARPFTAMGISLKDANGQLKPTSTLLGEVATKFQGYGDGANKVALAQAAFGKAGAQLIPLLNLGAAGLASASKEANALGYNFEGIAKTSEDFNDNLNRMGKAAIGLGVDIAEQLLPSLIEGEEKVLSFIKSARENGYLQDFAEAIKGIVTNLDVLAVAIGSKLAINAAVAAFGLLTSGASASAVAIGALESALGFLGGPAGILAIAAGATYYLATQEDIATAATDSLKEAQERLRGSTDLTRVSEEMAAVVKVKLARDAITATEALIAQAEALANQDTSSVTSNFGEAASLASNSSALWAGRADELRTKLTGLKAELGDTNREISIADALIDMAGNATQKAAPGMAQLGKAAQDLGARLDQATIDSQKFLNSLDAIGADKYTKAFEAYNNQLLQADAIFDKLVRSGASADQVIDFISAATQKAKDAFEAQTEAIRDQGDASQILSRLVSGMNDEFEQSANLAGLDETARRIATETYKLQADAAKALKDVMGPLTQEQQDYLDQLPKIAAAHVKLDDAMKLSEQVAKDWQNIWIQAGDSIADTFSKILVEGGSLMDGLTGR